MATRIVIASPKGGSGKTTLALNLALALAGRGRRTLLVDLDPQGGVGHSLARGDTTMPGLADLLMEAASATTAVLQTKQDGLALLPRGRLKASDAAAFEEALHTPGVLEGALAEVEGGFDVVLMDAPSGLGFATRAGLAVANWVLVPLQAEPLALRSIGQVLQVVEHVQQNENPGLKLLGVVPTMVNRRNEASMDVMLSVWTDFAGVFETTVPRSDVFLEASAQGVPVAFLAGAPSPEARRFDLLAEEVIAQLQRHGANEAALVHRPQRQLL